MSCARFISRLSFSAAGGICTARILSPVAAAASRWLTGQMPQIRAVMPAISVKGRPSQNFSKPRYSVTWKRAVSTAPLASRWIEILACPSIRVTGSIVIVRRAGRLASVAGSLGMAGSPCVSAEADLIGTAEVRKLSAQQGLQRSADAFG